MSVKFSVHAVERYMERVRPGLCFGDAAGELEALVSCGHAEIAEVSPEWMGGPELGEWLALGEDVAFPLMRQGGYLIATTCKVRGSESRTRRAADARRRAKRRERELRRWRANRKTRRDAA